MTKTIKLTQGRYAIVDAEDYDELNKVNWHFSSGYAIRNVSLGNGKRTTEQMHRVIMNTPKNMLTDHINHDTLNNKKTNLRIVTKGQNVKNARKKASATSKHKGVMFSKRKVDSIGKWVTVLSCDGKAYRSYHQSEVEAAIKYNEMAKQHFKEYAVLNEVDLMNLYDYQQKAKRTYPKDRWLNTNLANFSMGLSGEVGEVVDELKKVLYHGHELNVESIEDEMGDVLWYLSSLATSMNIDLDKVAKKNIEKLEKRYPEGFNEEASRNRDA